jgi:hypothetical protein
LVEAHVQLAIGLDECLELPDNWEEGFIFSFAGEDFRDDVLDPL